MAQVINSFKPEQMLRHNNTSVTSDTKEINSDGNNDLNRLKHLSEKLNLATRRPSVIQWNQVIENRRSMGLYSTDFEQITELETAVENRKQNKQDKETIIQPYPNKTKNLVSPINVLVSNKLPTINVSDLNNNNSDKALPKISSTIDETTDDALTELNRMKLLPCSINKADVKLIEVDRNVSLPSNQNTNEEKAEVIRNFCYCNIENNQNQHEQVGNGKSINSRCRNISKALDILRKDLIAMRIEDHKMARNFLELRGDLTMTRAQITCDEHADMLDDIAYKMEEEELLPGLVKACDLPFRFRGSLLSAFSPLRNIGVSRMNLNTRRFSIR